MIAEGLALLFSALSPPGEAKVAAPYVVEARYRSRHRRRVRRPVIIPPAEVVGPRKTETTSVRVGPDGRWIFLQPGGIDDVYSRVPPFNRSKAP